ncbi:MAG: SUMF1/EgtB/PvdO family nonheme iron enzyme [Phycisphaerae bacterium]|nr:SUMF1/EgtB/PvdO family nonheme iron enzyme [Phycisphaerae bacterium]
MLVGLVAAFFATPALAQPDPSGIDFVTIGAPGNPAYSGPDVNNLVTGRGGVEYEYRLGRTEVTTAQWMEFYNAFYGRAPFLTAPVRWGAVDRGAGASPRFTLSQTIPDAGLLPVSGPSWRTSAMFCNWLHNDKRTDLHAVMNGAYDVSTFGSNGQVFTDQAAHHPDARYWIPTLDEWIKGAYYDPNHGGLGIGGWWWRSVNGSNTPLIYGPPGQGQANADFDLPNGGHYRIPLGAYPDTVSPWGLLDVAGATREHLETLFVVDGIRYRFFHGSHWTSGDGGGDVIYGMGADFPGLPDLFTGFRIATVVPAPSAYLGVFLGLGALSARRPCRR